MKNKFLAITLLSVLCVASPSHLAFAVDKQTVGWVEMVSIFPGNLKIKAKLDTGAKNSSINVKKISYFQRNNDTWVKFDFRNFKDRKETIEAKVVRTAQIKRLGQEAASRPVIRLGICIGRTYKEAEVNLSDRSGFNYQMLIGRSFLAGSFLIDPEISFVSQPDCKGETEQ
jgi:hypothetical protein